MGINFAPVTQYYQIGFAGYGVSGIGDSNIVLDPFNSLEYFNMIAVTSTTDYNGAYPGAGTDIFSINGYNIGPTGTANVDQMISMINAASPWTGVIANRWALTGGAGDNNTAYISLTCAYTGVQTAITLANVNGTPLGVLGFPVGSVTLPNAIYGGSFTTLTNGSTIVLNGVTVTFTTGGGLNIAGAIATLNAASGVTNVLARQAGTVIQLNSISQAPINFGATTGSAASNLGFAANTVYASAQTYNTALQHEYGNMRWAGVASTISSNLTPTYYGTALWTSNNGVCGPEGLTWILGVEHIDQVYTRGLASDGFGDDGVDLYGPAAIQRLTARALALPWTSNRLVYNPNIVVGGSSIAYNTSQVLVQNITAPVLANVYTYSSCITVTQLSPGVGTYDPAGGY